MRTEEAPKDQCLNEVDSIKDCSSVLRRLRTEEVEDRLEGSRNLRRLKTEEVEDKLEIRGG